MTVSLDAAARAIRDLLEALGRSAHDDPELEGTPERVAHTWAEELIDGYAIDPARLLADSLVSTEAAMVTALELDYVSVCPHHLLPVQGRAHVGYLPGGRIVGVGVLSQLVDALSHRLVLQESLGRQITEALVTHLGARAAGVVLDARHGCLSMRGERQRSARVVTQSFAGEWAQDPVARAEFLSVTPRPERV